MGVEWHDLGTHWTREVDGRIDRCVSCNKPLEYSKTTGCCFHRCSVAHEGAKLSGERGHAEFGRKQASSYGGRLSAGFDMAQECGDDP
jgi:hypothetical protein